jgi:DNA modification methylase
MAARRSSKKSPSLSDSATESTAAASSTPADSLAAHLGRVHHQDCVAGMESLPAGSVDLVFADPPFNIGYAYDVYHDNKGYQEYLDWSTAWIRGVHRVLKDDGTFWLAIGDEYAAELKLIAQREVGFHIRSWVVWYYTFGVNCKTKFSRSHAHLFHFVKHPQKFTFRSADLENRIPSARQLVYGDGRANPDGRLPDDTWILRPQDLAGHFTPEEDTWYFPRVAGTFKERAGFHGCQMPEQLLGRIIRSCSHEGDVVLDPFSGSATTLVVAKKLGRNHLGFDLSPDYVKRGIDRLATVHVGDALEGAPEPTMSAPTTAKGKRLADKQSKLNGHASGATNGAVNGHANGSANGYAKPAPGEKIIGKRPKPMSTKREAVRIDPPMPLFDNLPQTSGRKSRGTSKATSGTPAKAASAKNGSAAATAKSPARGKSARPRKAK